MSAQSSHTLLPWPPRSPASASRGQASVARSGTFDSTVSGELSDPEEIKETNVPNVVIMVIGNKRSSNIFDNEFRQWRKRASKESSASFKFWKFDMIHLGKMSIEIEMESGKLAEYMRSLQVPHQTTRRGSSEALVQRATTPPDEYEPRELASSRVDNAPKFILIGHALGCWIVRSLIYQQRYESITVNTIATIFLDDLPSPSTYPVDYSEYLGNAKAEFKWKLKSEDEEKVASRLRTVDLQFDEAVKFLTANKKPRPMEVYRSPVWLQEQSEGPQNKTKSLALINISYSLHRREASTETRECLARFESRVKEILNAHRKLFQSSHDTATSPMQHQVGRPLQPTRRPESVPLPFPINQPRSSFVSKPTADLASPPPSRPMSPTGPGPIHVRRPVQQVLDLAKASIETGDLQRANQLLQGMEVKPVDGSPSPLTDNFAIQTLALDRTIVRMYLGDYDSAASELGTFSEKWTGWSSDLQRDAEFYLAIALILDGKYEDAIGELKNIVALSRLNGDTSTERSAQRELALALAYSGNFTDAQHIIVRAREMMPDLHQGTKEPVPHLVRVREANMLLTEATIHLLKGNYRDGLEIAREAFKSMSRHLGKAHLKTLETGKLLAHLLALNSRSSEAETKCRETLDLMKLELGSSHPETLEATSLLAYVFRLQARHSEAVSLGRDVCASLRLTGSDNFRTLDARAELAANYRSSGDYLLAERELHDIIRLSKRRYTWNHHKTLSYASELAQVYYCCGYWELAESLAIKVLEDQVKAYSLSSVEERSELVFQNRRTPTGGSPTDMYNNMHASGEDTMLLRLQSIFEDIKLGHQFADLLDDLIDDLKECGGPNFKTRTAFSIPRTVLDNLNVDLRAVLSDTGIFERGADLNSLSTRDGVDTAHMVQRHSRLLRHPFLLQTLQLVAVIIFRKPNPELALAREILELAAKWGHKALGSSHALTLKCEYELAMVIRDGQGLKAAKQRLFSVYTRHSVAMGKLHPETLSVKRELLVTICASSTESSDCWSKYDITEQLDVVSLDEPPLKSDGDAMRMWDKVEACSKQILLVQEDKLGRLHPETLRTLLWIFIVQLDSQADEKQADATGIILLRRLQLPAVIQQRELEALLMQHQIAFLYEKCGWINRAKEIRQALETRDRKMVASPSKRAYDDTMRLLSGF